MRLVVIDDNTILMQGIVELLHLNGCQAIGADDPREGLRLIEQHHPHVVVVDVMMPYLSGVDVLQWIRRQPVPIKSTFVIIMHSDSLSYELNCDAFMVKPFDPDDLLRLVLDFADSDQATGIRHYLETGQFVR